MKITVVGGGPGGLFFALLTKRHRPGWEIEVYEQNRADDTFGFGVVFSDETLEEFFSRDTESYERVREDFAYWDDIVIQYKGSSLRCGGNGFCGCSRKYLLGVLQDRCQDLGVQLHFEDMVDPTTLDERFSDANIILAADGVNSPIREHFSEHFSPSIEIKSNRFCWMGSTRPLEDFTYFFKDTEHGPICAHTYQYELGASAWVFEMSDECWVGHGFEEYNEESSKAILERIFEEELEGHPLLLNRSFWRHFPRIFCKNWYHKNIVILGDAKASAHFSIGSGSKLAMECAIALHDAVIEHAEDSVETAFQKYDELRRTPVQITQHNADVSLAWFEHMDRSWDMDPEQFAAAVMCRAKSITYDDLIIRDPEFVERIDTAWYERYFRESGYDYRASRPTPMFTRFKLRDMEVRNRVVMSPMAQYSATPNGDLTDWHLVHYGGHAKGGMGLMYVEMTCPSASARITTGCAGLWTDAHESQWKRIVDFTHNNTSTKICMQLGHAGRKGSTQLGWQKMDYPIKEEDSNWPIYSASPIAYMEGLSQIPREMGRADMDTVIGDFVQATERSHRAGFDMLELHCAHGYLLASFLSPLTNTRVDKYGGAIENRLRFPLEVFTAMRAVWPEEKPMSVRISASDWKDGGISEEDVIFTARALANAGCDLIDVSAGQTVANQEPVYGRMFQVPFAESVRNVANIATMAVGSITDQGQVNTILHARRADLVAMARPHLWDPYFSRKAAAWYGVKDNQGWEKQYLAGEQQVFSVQMKARAATIDMQIKAKPKRHHVTDSPADD